MARPKQHAQRGRDIGTCPDCMRKMYLTEQTINLPIRINGRWKACLVHRKCADDRTE